MGKSTLYYDELHTMALEIESVINAPPITYVYDDNESVYTRYHQLNLSMVVKLTQRQTADITKSSAQTRLWLGEPVEPARLP